MPLAEKWATLKQKMGFGRPSTAAAAAQQHHHHHHSHESSESQDPYANLSEVAAPPPVQNENESAHTYAHHTLEEQRG